MSFKNPATNTLEVTGTRFRPILAIFFQLSNL